MKRTVNTRWAAWLLPIGLLTGCPAPGPDDGGTDGARPDTSGSTDSGRVDTGNPTDTGNPSDTGTPGDTGTPDDTGTPGDTGTPIDSGTPGDTGTPVDTGTPGDAGTPTDTGTPVDTGTPIVDAGTDAGGTPAAWNASCTAASACAAGAGESGFCGLGFPNPICLHTCTGANFSLCENGSGICVPDGGTLTTKTCLPKCGDGSRTACAAGSACALLGYRDNRSLGGGVDPIGVCEPACSATSTCNGAGRQCDLPTTVCRLPGCANGCPSNTTCQGVSCVPNPRLGLYNQCTPRGVTVGSGCDGNLCIGALNSAGFCTAYCTTDNLSACGTGACWADLNVLTASTGVVIGVAGGSFENVAGRASGVCLPACNESADCPANFHCGDYSGRRVCLFGATPQATTQNGAAAGSVCRTGTDCASGSCVGVNGFRDGVCQLAAPGPCPANTTRLADMVTCLPNCTGNQRSECPGSFVCNTTTPPARCLLGTCRDNTDCDPGFVCDPSSATCVTTLVTAGGVVGNACAAATGCRSGLCLTGEPGGYCSASCTMLPDFSDTCPTGSICDANLPGVGGLCIDLCDAQSGITRFGSCRSGYNCSPIPSDPRFGRCESP